MTHSILKMVYSLASEYGLLLDVSLMVGVELLEDGLEAELEFLPDL